MSAVSLGPVPKTSHSKLRIELITYVRKDPSAGVPLSENLMTWFAAAADETAWSLYPRCVTSEDEALAVVADDGIAGVIFASPNLVGDNAAGPPSPSPLAIKLRAAAVESSKPLVLLGLELSEAPVGSGKVDAFLPRNPDPHQTESTVTALCDRLCLKLPPVHREFESENVLRLQVVSKRIEMLEAYRLRYRSYRGLGYLPEDDSIDGGLDIDAFDKLSCQFIVVDHRDDRIIGTFRLVTDRLSPFSSAHFYERPSQVFERQRIITDEIVETYAGTRVRRDYASGTPLPLPIFRSLDFSSRWLSEFSPILGKCCEVSRIVVDPAYRGMHLLDLIMRAAAAIAYDLGKSVVLLECAPHHIGMYEKYGYRTIGLHGTYKELDQTAAGMRLDLPGTPDDEQYQMAKRLIEMIRSQPALSFDDQRMRHLCACAFPNCWQNGSYSFREHSQCPLVEWHMREEP